MFHLPDMMQLLVRIPVMIPALVLHELGHAYVALRCGDDTAKRAGRITLNPVAHLDLIGTICLLFAPIGWAKPVPINPYYFRKPRRDEILVSIAGVTTNFAQALIFLLLAKIIIPLLPMPVESTQWNPVKPGPVDFALVFLFLGVVINIGLGIFNLIPLFPLDGSHIVSNLLPYEQRRKFDEFGKMAPFVLLALVFFGGSVLSAIVRGPTVLLLQNVLNGDDLLKISIALGNI
jgi:Zn-dependent protease